ncbi:hypothetical protein MBLNU230_g7203t1 [Neophaeotheca triangularis]
MRFRARISAETNLSRFFNLFSSRLRTGMVRTLEMDYDALGEQFLSLNDADLLRHASTNGLLAPGPYVAYTTLTAQAVNVANHVAARDICAIRERVGEGLKTLILHQSRPNTGVGGTVISDLLQQPNVQANIARSLPGLRRIQLVSPGQNEECKLNRNGQWISSSTGQVILRVP